MGCLFVSTNSDLCSVLVTAVLYAKHITSSSTLWIFNSTQRCQVGSFTSDFYSKKGQGSVPQHAKGLCYWPLVDAAVSQIRYLPVILHSDECHKTSLMISQHCFKYWLGAVRQQAITFKSMLHLQDVTLTGNGLLPDSTKSILEAMLTNHQWANVSANLCCHMASLGHNELISSESFAQVVACSQTAPIHLWQLKTISQPGSAQDINP